MWSFDVSDDVLPCQGFGDHPILEELQLQDFFGWETVVSVNSFWKVVFCFQSMKHLESEEMMLAGSFPVKLHF